MKNRFIRVTVVTIIVSIFYFIVFTDKVMDTSKNGKVDILYKVDTLLNENGYVVIGKPNTIKLIKVIDTINYKDFYVVGIYKNQAIIAKEEDKENLEVYIKFSPKAWFKKHEVSVYKGKLAAPNFESNPDAKAFITRITEGCKEGVNFAGHYTIIYWGCGTSCQYGVVVDRKTGEIYNEYQSSLGSEYKKDSNLIILNSDFVEENAEYIPLYQLNKFEIKIWKGTKFVNFN